MNQDTILRGNSLFGFIFQILDAFSKKTLIHGNEEGLDGYVETALDQHALLERTTVPLCMTHNPGGYERVTIGWIPYHTALMLVHVFKSPLNLDGG